METKIENPHASENEVPKDLHQPSNFTVALVMVGVVILLIALFFIGWFPHRHQENQARDDAKKTATNETMVAVIPPKKAEATNDIILPCDVKPYQATAIYTRTNGYLKKWYFDIQSHVEEGQVMAEIDAPEVDAQLAQAKASLEQNKAVVTRAEAAVRLAQTTLERYVQAQKTSAGSVTQEDLDTKQSALDDATSGLLQAKANVVAAEANVQQLTVTQGFEKIIAPFSGTVTTRNYDVGALLSPSSTGPGKEIFDLAQTDQLRVDVNVPQTFVTNVKTGQTAYLRVRNYGDKEFSGTVARTSGSLDSTTRTLTVEIDFPNKDGSLFAGMYGQIRLPVSDERPMLVIPSSALLFNANGLRVATVVDGKIHWQSIDVARDMGTEIEVSSGLNSDDQVVSNPAEKLVEGLEVHILGKDKPGKSESFSLAQPH